MLYDERLIYVVNDLIMQLQLLEKDHLIIAMDGRSASGKTTLSKCLKERLDCNLIHMDDFFLRPEQRSDERSAIPGENVDHDAGGKIYQGV